jgi:hypothetical protein
MDTEQLLLDGGKVLHEFTTLTVPRPSLSPAGTAYCMFPPFIQFHWVLYVDVVCLCDDGNLMDSASLAAIAALKTSN